jgi:nickel-dependent lactate racemase
METIEVPYGQGHLTLRVPEGGFEVLSCREAVSEGDQLAEILHTRRFRRYAGKTTLCIVNDGTRPTKTRNAIEQGGLDCDYIVATGAHAPPTEEELVYIFGPQFRRRRILIHDARRSSCRLLGTTQRHTPVRFNEAIFNYERILVIGSVEPHYFAGFTGGRKGLLPGVAAFDTIEKNHAHYFSAGASSLRLRGNPVHEDMMEAANLVKIPVLSLNMVLSKDNELLGAFAGTLEDSLSEAAKLARSYYAVEISREADLVIACAPYPMDADLYQSQKALLNAARACRRGGTVILISKCRNGIGPPAFYELMVAHRNLDGVISFAKDHYKLGYHKAASFAEILLRHPVGIVSDLPSEALPPLHMRAVSPPVLERMLAAVSSEGGTTYYMPQASVTVPIVLSRPAEE